jgi:hypothetical protein
VEANGTHSRLRYLEAARLQTPAGELDHVELLGTNEQALGNLDGVLIDPVERRLRFYVVARPGLYRSRRYLLPSDCAAQMDHDGRSLRIDLDATGLARCEEFETSSVLRYSDEDLIGSIFQRRSA